MSAEGTPLEEEHTEEEANQTCKCGQKHNRAQKPSANDIVRLACVMTCNEHRKLVTETIFRGLGRRDLDNPDRELPWDTLAKTFMDEDFCPELTVLDERITAGSTDLEPGLPPIHTRNGARLKVWSDDLKKKITVWQDKFDRSGQNDPEKRWEFMGQNPNRAHYAFWLIIVDAGILEGFVRLTGEDGAEEGLGEQPKKKNSSGGKRNRSSTATAQSSSQEDQQKIMEGALTFLNGQNKQETPGSAELALKKQRSELLLGVLSGQGVDEETKELCNDLLKKELKATFLM